MSHRRELKVISRGLDLCESTLCSDVANVRTWVTSALEEQQRMVLRVMSEMVKLGKAIEGSRRARGAEGKVVEEGGEILSRVRCAGGGCSRDEGERQGQGSGYAHVAGGSSMRAGGSLRRWLWQCCWCGRWNTRPAPAAYSP